VHVLASMAEDLSESARRALERLGVRLHLRSPVVGAATDRSGRVLVAEDLSLPDHPEVFVAGDLALVREGERAVPGVAPAAKQMGRHVAKAIGSRLRGRAAPAFRYRDQGTLATIGRMAAVVEVGRVHLRGWLARWFWLVAHLFFLIGFRNRIVVLLDWAVSYWTYQRHARIVLPAGSGTEPGRSDAGAP